MPYRRRASRRTRTSKPRKYMRYGRRRVRKIGRLGGLRVVRKCVEQNVYNTAVAGTAAASGSVVAIGAAFASPTFGAPYYNIPFAADFQLSDLINYTELTAIADKYKINWVKVKVYSTSNTASTGGASQLPSMLWSIDEDDSVTPPSNNAGMNALKEKMGIKYRFFKNNGSGINIFWKPRVAREIMDAAGAAVGAEVSPARFNNCSFPNIPHFGLKGYLQDVNLAVTPGVLTQFKFDVTMSVTLKDIQ